MQISTCIDVLISQLESNTAVISPGSRNAPIIYSLNKHFSQTFSVIDERSAAFIALGIAKSKQQPVVLNCTSGTAVLNYYPAIAEAFYARVPLIVITADRPPEKIDTWDGQAIRQNEVFQNHTRLSISTPSEYKDESEFGAVADKVNKQIKEGIPGPIHINVPIREPFYDFDKSVEKSKKIEHPNREKNVSLFQLQEHLGLWFSGNNVLIFNGQQAAEKVTVNVDCLAWQTVEISDVTANYQGELDFWDGLIFVNNTEEIKELIPDILITTGTTTLSKGLKRLLTKYRPIEHYHISHFNEFGAMFGTEPIVVHPDQCIRHNLDPLIGMAQWTDFKKSWVQKTESFTSALLNLPWSEWNEFSATKKVLESIPENSVLHLANSMPVRYASYLQSILNERSVEVRSNRGTSGIDGCTSTALGQALSRESNVYLITGDVAFLYDSNAFLNYLPHNLKIVVLNNNGGGIFELIEGPEKMGEAQKYQITNHNISIEKMLEAFDVKHYEADSMRDITRYMEKASENEKLTVIEVKTDRIKNQEFYRKFKQIKT